MKLPLEQKGTFRVRPVDGNKILRLARITGCLMALLVSVRAAAETPVCAKAVRLMSFNIRMGAGQEGPFEVKKGTLGFLPQCAEVVKAANPDVVGIQEIDRKTNRADGLDETAELAKLCGLHGTFVPKLKLPGGDYGLAILSKEEPLSVETYYMKGSAHTRALIVCEFADYILANTHFPLKDELCTDASYIVRAKLSGRKKPVFFMGDLNSRPHSEAIKSLQEEFEPLSDPTIPTFPAKAPDCTIDYVMVDKEHAASVSLEKRQVIAAPQATDHCALLVDVKIARPL